MARMGHDRSARFDLHGTEKQRYLAWLMTPPREREPKGVAELAAELGVDRRTLLNWRTQDKEFMEEWERLYLTTVGNPGRKQEIMDTLFRTATDPDDPKHVSAAKTYFEIEGSLKPAKTEISVQMGDASKLTMEQLDQLLAAKAEQEKERRLKVVGDGD